MQPESRLNKSIKAYLKGKGAKVIKIHGGDNFQEEGLPDMIVCYQGIFIGLETKTPVGKLRPRQQYVLDQIKKAGGYVGVPRSLEDVKRLIAKIDRKEGL